MFNSASMCCQLFFVCVNSFLPKFVTNVLLFFVFFSVVIFFMQMYKVCDHVTFHIRFCCQIITSQSPMSAVVVEW